MVYLSFLGKNLKTVSINKTKYRLLDLIGEGSFGCVVRSKDVVTSEIYALKIINIPEKMGPAQKREYMDRIHQEISAMDHFKYHKNIVKMRHACHKKKGSKIVFFIVMELCDFDLRKYLDHHIKLNKPKNHLKTELQPIFPEDEIRYWMAPLVDALYELYVNQFMHRDLKFENLLLKTKPKKERKPSEDVLDEETKKLQDALRATMTQPVSRAIETLRNTAMEIEFESVESNSTVSSIVDDEDTILAHYCYDMKLCDLGLAKKMQTDLTKTFCGTPLTMSPEQLMRQQYGYKSDIWALGTLFLELITGDRTTIYKDLDYDEFRKSREKALEKEVNAFDLDKVLKPFKLSDVLCDLVKKLLQKDVNQRLSFEELKSHPFFLTAEDKKKAEEKKKKEEEEKVEVKKDSTDTTEDNLVTVHDVTGEISLTPETKKKEEDEEKKKKKKEQDGTTPDKVSFFLNPGIYEMTISNLLSSKINCFRILLELDKTKEEEEEEEEDDGEEDLPFKRKKFYHFEPSLAELKKDNGMWVMGDPIKGGFCVRNRPVLFTFSFEPSFWTKVWSKLMKYQIVVKKKAKYSKKEEM